MDGTASMFALKELYGKLGIQNVEYYIDDKPQLEVELVLKKYGITLSPVKNISDKDNFILVDCNDLGKAHTTVAPKSIIEVIDHHPRSEDLKDFTNAKIDIQEIGAVATLVVERFVGNDITPSLESATLLYHAIASNTVNLKGDVTTERDLQAFNSLEKLYSKNLSRENIEDIFKQKSQINNLEEVILSDLKIIGVPIIIAQLELANANEFFNKNVAELRRIMKLLSNQSQIEDVMLNIIDILNGYNIILCPSQNLRYKLSKIGLDFKDDVAKTDKIIMRKQFAAKLT